MIRMLKRLVLAWLTLGLGGFAAAEVVVLKNGDRITGDVVKIWDGEVYIEPEYADEFAIDMDYVQAIETDEPMEIELKDKTKIEGRLAMSGDEPIVITEDGGTVALNLSQIEEINEFEDYFDWSVASDLSLDVSKGNSDAETARWYTKAYTKFGDHKHTLEYTLDRQSADGVTSKEEDNFRYTYNWSFGDQWGAYGLVGWQRDPIRDLDKRVSVGTGVGYDIWDKASRAWHLALGADFINEEIGGVSNDSVAAHWIFRFSYDIFSGDANVFHDHDIWSYVSGRNNEIFDSKTGISYELTDDIDATVQLNYRYESEPAMGAENDDLQYLIGLKIEFD